MRARTELAAAALVLLAGCSGPRHAHHRVEIHAMRFQPATLALRAGDTVEWVNDDLVPHTVTAASFDSQVIPPSGRWTLTATAAGTIAYACKLHPEMTATLEVR